MVFPSTSSGWLSRDGELCRAISRRSRRVDMNGWKTIFVPVLMILSIFGYCKEAYMSERITIQSVFSEGGFLPKEYTCDGDGYSPPLSWSEVPSSARSLVIVSADPDAPAGTFMHWIVFNLPPEVKELPKNTTPEALRKMGACLGKNTAGQTDYCSPCPPRGTHRYFFRIYALDTKLSIDEGCDISELSSAIEGHIVAQGSVMGMYKRG